jgi:hypothetical protein
MSVIKHYYQRLRQKSQGWHHLSQLERHLFIQALVLFPCLYMALRFWGLQRVQGLLASRTPPIVQSVEIGAHIEGQTWQPSTQVSRDWVLAKTIDMVERAGWYLPELANCLRRSLVLWYLLRSQGIESDLKIGVRRSETGEFQAHAWVEYSDRVLNDRPDIHSLYAAFDGAVNDSSARWTNIRSIG